MEAEGEVVTTTNNAVIRTENGSFLIKRAHCECSAQAIPIIENSMMVGYYCPECGPLTHDALVYVWHPA